MTKNKLVRKSLAIAGMMVAVFFGACSKDNNSTPVTTPPPVNGSKLSRIEYDGGSYENITYNGNGSIGKITVHYEYTGGNSQNVVYSFVYNGGLISEIQTDNGSKYKYFYVNQQVVKTEVYNNTGNLMSKFEYGYSNGKVSRVEGFLHLPGGGVPNTPSYRFDNTYNSNGNLQKLIQYYSDPSTGVLEKTDEIVFDQYDTKRNTLILFETNPFLPIEVLIPNNPLNETHYDVNGVIQETVTHSYTYDSEGNPITRKTTSKMVGLPEEIENAKFFY